MSDPEARAKRWRIVAIILGALAVPSMADGIVTYVEWFQQGFIEPIQRVKAFIRGLLWWVPFTLPDFWIEYFWLGIVFLRSFAVSGDLETLEQNAARLFGMKSVQNALGSKSKGSVSAGLGYTTVLIFWPIVLTALLTYEASEGGKIGVRLRTVYAFFTSLLLGIAVVLALSDALVRLGWG